MLGQLSALHMLHNHGSACYPGSFPGAGPVVEASCSFNGTVHTSSPVVKADLGAELTAPSMADSLLAKRLLCSGVFGMPIGVFRGRVAARLQEGQECLDDIDLSAAAIAVKLKALRKACHASAAHSAHLNQLQCTSMLQGCLTVPGKA